MGEIDRLRDHKFCDFRSYDLGITIAFLFGVSFVKRVGM